MEGWMEDLGFVVRPLLWVFPHVILGVERLGQGTEELQYRGIL